MAARMILTILCAALALSACAALPPPTAGLAVQTGPCGLEYRLDAAAGVPLSVPAGEWVVRVEAQGGATVTLTRACAPAPQEADDGAGSPPR